MSTIWLTAALKIGPGLSTFGAEERAIPISGIAARTNNAADILWLGMHEAGMIDAEQFQYVQETDACPAARLWRVPRLRRRVSSAGIKLPAASSRGINVDVIAPTDSNLSSFVVHEWLDVRNGAGSSIYILRCKQRGIRPSLRNKLAKRISASLLTQTNLLIMDGFMQRLAKYSLIMVSRPRSPPAGRMKVRRIRRLLPE
jgi:hypothetical protein